MCKMLPILVLVADAGLAVVLLVPGVPDRSGSPPVPAAPRRSFIVDQADVDRANARAAAVRAAAAPASPHVPAPAVSLSGLRWRMGGFGTVMIASFARQNGEAFAVEDIDIVCELRAKSGTPIGYAANRCFKRCRRTAGWRCANSIWAPASRSTAARRTPPIARSAK
jgi:hypothetical protein